MTGPTKEQQDTARDILRIIADISYSKKYEDYRIQNGSRGTTLLIEDTIREKYKL